MEVITEINHQAIETMFHNHYTGLCRYAFTILKDQEEAEEVVQQLFIRLWEKRRETNILKDTRAYLYRAVYNQSLNELKRLKRNAMHTEVTEDLMVKADGGTSDGIMSRELEVRIETAIQTLPEKCGEVFRLSRYDEMTYKEIAEKLEISVKTVENQMGKALRLMRQELKDYLPLVLIIILLSKGW